MNKRPTNAPSAGSLNPIGPREVAVWWMELDSPSHAVIAQWHSCLDAEEKARADRFHFQEDRWTYAAAHWLIRTALTSVGGLPAADWRFIVEPGGRPVIAPAIGRSDIRFNLSHTRGFVACAICIGSDIGIDVEALVRRTDLEIAERFFSPSEVAILRAAPREEQPDIFLRFWTLNEAFILATGEGLSRALDSFSFSLDPVAISFHPVNSDEETQWQFVAQKPTPRYLLALAVRRPAACPISLMDRSVRISAALPEHATTLPP
jgi:4'-phosphopantetheinyl transferase